MDTDQKIDALTQKVDALYISAEKTRNYFKWTLIVTAVTFILPLLAALFVVPSFLSNYTSTINSLSQ